MERILVKTMTKQSNQLPSSAETEFKQRLKAATNLRRKWVYASEVAGGLCHAAKALRKVVDLERRFDLLCDFIFKDPTVRRKMDELSELATHISDWETIPSHEAFFTDFKRSFASRYSFW